MNTGYCSLIVKGHNINFQEIEKNIHRKPTQIFKEGEKTNNVIGASQIDLIRFDQKIDENNTPNNVLNNFVDMLLPLTTYINQLSKEFDVFFKCYLQSDYAQINFRLSPEVMTKIASLKIDFEISILSWGGAE